MPIKADAAALTRRFKKAQNRRAAILAALTAAYYRRAVDFKDPRSVERWLNIWAPRILREAGLGAREAAEFANRLRVLEAPGAPAYSYQAINELNLEQIRTSLEVVGPKAVQSKFYDVRSNPDLSPVDRQAEVRKAFDSSITAVTGAVARHVQNPARQTIYEGQKGDQAAVGYVRVTQAKPCYFCAMLASRGPVFDEESFDLSDARFTGGGKVKVHDSCGCATKTVYDPKSDEFVDKSREFEAQWLEWGVGGGSDAILNFRRGYEGREHLIGT